MKRHEALAPLSREHHRVLILSQLLRSDAPAYKDLPTDVPGKQRYARQMFEETLKPHMLLEEEQLFPAISGLHPDIDQLIYILLDDHAEIETLFQKMMGEANPTWLMDQLAELLRLHVRMEERELFELIQLHADEALLSSLQLDASAENTTRQ